MSEVESGADRTIAIGSGAAPSGALWKNRYVIEREIGRGGFGIVFLARDQQLLAKPVVIKVRQDASDPDPYFQKKFQQEIEALARIDHPGVVGVLDVGESPEGKPFLVMQYVEGLTLRSEISPTGMDFRRVAHIMRQVGQALGAAHDKGIFHRDLKPENIMLTRSGETEEYVKLIDFGIAAVRDSQVVAATQTSKIIGTLSYMAPEQVIGKGSGASDIYSLGVIAFEMLTGQRPDVSPQGATVKPRELRADIPEAAEQVILKALSYQPEQRLSRPREFGDELSRALGVEPAITSPLPAPPVSSLPAKSSSSAGLETAYVLFMDIVAYSKMKMDLQSQSITKLVEIVRNTAEYKRAQSSDQIVSLPTGDGMALVFFQAPTAPVECAIEIAHALKSYPDIKLRMGVHSGLVYRVADINTNRNVAGGGINLAQRVMDCGDAGHILLSKTIADDLGQLSDWEPALHDLGEAEVKHGVKVNVVNFYTGEVGNSELPEKLKKSREITAAPPLVPPVAPPVPVAVPMPSSAPKVVLQTPPPPPLTMQDAAPATKSNKGVLVAVGVVVIIVVATVASLKFGPFAGRSASPSGPTSGPTSGGPTSLSGVGPTGATPGMIPPAGAPPASGPASSESAPGPSSSTPPVSIPAVPSQPAAASTSKPATPVAAAKSPQSEPASPAPGPSASSSAPTPSTPAPPSSSSAADRAALQEARERLMQLTSRANAVSRSMQTMEDQQAHQGLNMRADMSGARDSMGYLMDEAKSAVASGDSETAKRNMDLAERQIEKLEAFLGH